MIIIKIIFVKILVVSTSDSYEIILWDIPKQEIIMKFNLGVKIQQIGKID